ncbi:MAG: saccharopine dehydrogenase NADP-binding domain-containing protein, partial [Propionibacterium sp.]|nr:saccharopine dehydrogenase NADP-binding domain-containing protein [Propionibacterium sp.]
MTTPPGDRPLDLVLFGATGFVGNLTADRLGARLPVGARWALAGRREDKLRRTRDRIVAANPGAPVPELIRADAADRDALRNLAERARVVITTVGPYLEYGEPLV